MSAFDKVADRAGLTVRREKGVAALEFALIAPLFFLLLFGAMTYAWLFYTQTVFRAAAESGVHAVFQLDRSGYSFPQDTATFAAVAKTRSEDAAKAALQSSLPGMVGSATFDSTVSNHSITVTIKHPPDGFLYAIGIRNIKGSATTSYW